MRRPFSRSDRDEAALIDEMAELGRRLLALRPQRAATPPPPGIHWRSGYGIFAAPLAVRRGANPQSGSEICPGLRLFHDAGPGAVFSWSQTLGAFARPAADPGLRLTVYDFPGSFVSIVAEVPAEAASALGPGRKVGVEIEATPLRPLTCFLRLNLTGDSARETLHETLVLATGTREVDFDLDGLEIGAGACRAAWLDIILHAPRMCRIDIARLVLSIGARDGERDG